jgi:MFS family permease
LASTSSIPLYGQISDVFGRHSVLQASILFILIGSALAAGAQAWAMLLVGRALQGLGFAGLQTVTKVILSDKVSLKDTSLTNTLFSLFYGLSFAVGPLIGGYLTRVSSLRSRPRSFYLTTPGKLALVFYH